MRRKILLLYITVRSGHYQAARALEEGIRALNPEAEVLTIDAFQYLNPVLARIVDRLYLSVIQNAPELWDKLYDNPKVVKRSKWLRRILHTYDSPRLQGLLEEFRPDAVACTQAFPCGLVADYKKEKNLAIPLYGVVTDFQPHAFWVHPLVDGYLVGAEESCRWLADHRIERSRIFVTGIPISPCFAQTPDMDLLRRRLQVSPEAPAVLLMGGGQGLGPILESVKALDALKRPLQLLVVAGSNEKLYHRLIVQIPRLKSSVRVFGHVGFVADLMRVARIIITKPGGLTTSEALAVGLPIIVLNPIPGQEVKNALFLARAGVARQTDNPAELPKIVEHLLDRPQEIDEMASSSKRLGRPHSATEAARIVLGVPCSSTRSI